VHPRREKGLVLKEKRRVLKGDETWVERYFPVTGRHASDTSGAQLKRGGLAGPLNWGDGVV